MKLGENEYQEPFSLGESNLEYVDDKTISFPVDANGRDVKPDDEVEALNELAALRETVKKLGELAWHMDNAMNDKYDSAEGTAHELSECRRLLNDPAVQALIEEARNE